MVMQKVNAIQAARILSVKPNTVSYFKTQCLHYFDKSAVVALAEKRARTKGKQNKKLLTQHTQAKEKNYLNLGKAIVFGAFLVGNVSGLIAGMLTLFILMIIGD